MSLLCKWFGHDWDRREINPNKEKDYGYQPICERCDKFGEKTRPDDWGQQSG